MVITQKPQVSDLRMYGRVREGCERESDKQRAADILSESVITGHGPLNHAICCLAWAVDWTRGLPFGFVPNL